MAKDHPNVSELFQAELFQAKQVTDQQVDVAVGAVLADSATEAYPLAKGLTHDLVGTLRTNTHAAEALTGKPA